MTLLAAEDIRKQYHHRSVVDGVSLNIHSGEIVGLLGPNGAGKTTSFYMIVGLIKTEHGKISIGDHDITRLPMHARAQLGIGYLPQEPSIFRKLNVADNLRAVLEIRKDITAGQKELIIEDLLHEFGIGHL
ncbi:MAG: ATP-binding cassette domain-containing protein, partial [Methylococcales bacterium]